MSFGNPNRWLIILVSLVFFFTNQPANCQSISIAYNDPLAQANDASTSDNTIKNSDTKSTENNDTSKKQTVRFKKDKRVIKRIVIGTFILLLIATAIAVPIAVSVGTQGHSPSFQQNVTNKNAFYEYVQVHSYQAPAVTSTSSTSSGGSHIPL